MKIFATLSMAMVASAAAKMQKPLTGATAPNMDLYNIVNKLKAAKVSQEDLVKVIEKATHMSPSTLLNAMPGIIKAPPEFYESIENDSPGILSGNTGPDKNEYQKFIDDERKLSGSGGILASNTHGMQTVTVLPEVYSMTNITHIPPSPPAMFNGLFFEDPRKTGECRQLEAKVSIYGVEAVTCAPKCVLNVCKFPTPPEVDHQNVKEACALASPMGEKYCALLCNPESDGCGGKAVCESLGEDSRMGICMYPLDVLN